MPFFGMMGVQNDGDGGGWSGDAAFGKSRKVFGGI